VVVAGSTTCRVKAFLPLTNSFQLNVLSTCSNSLPPWSHSRFGFWWQHHAFAADSTDSVPAVGPGGPRTACACPVPGGSTITQAQRGQGSLLLCPHRIHGFRIQPVHLSGWHARLLSNLCPFVVSGDRPGKAAAAANPYGFVQPEPAALTLQFTNTLTGPHEAFRPRCRVRFPFIVVVSRVYEPLSPGQCPQLHRLGCAAPLSESGAVTGVTLFRTSTDIDDKILKRACPRGFVDASR